MVTIVVPIYNAEKHIIRCVNSIIAQTVKNWELILVNDGSSDSSSKMCHGFGQYDKRIRVIEQTNQGANKARRNGLREANGEWITFVDADDYIPCDALENLLSKMSDDTDIVLGWMNFRQVYEDKLSIEEYRSRNIGCRNIDVGPVAHLYRRSLFNDSVFDFPRDINVGEDNLMNIRLAFRTTKPVQVVHKPVYVYDQSNANSAIHTFNPTIDYEFFFHEHRLKSIPQEHVSLYMHELIDIRIYRLKTYIENNPFSRHWAHTTFVKNLRTDIINYGYKKNKTVCSLIFNNNLIMQLCYVAYDRLIRLKYATKQSHNI